jgi:hypothetical protein
MTISVASAGTVIVCAIFVAVPVFVALANRSIVMSAALAPSKFDTMSESIKYALPLLAALLTTCVADVLVKRMRALPTRTLVADARFGFAIAFS